MCDGTGLTPKLKARSSGGFGGTVAPLITPRQLERPEFQKDFMVIDIRDPKEIDDKVEAPIWKLKYPDLLYTQISMGYVLSSSYLKSEEGMKLLSSRSKIAFLCNSGSRSQTAADLMVSTTNYDCYNLKGGIQSVKSKFATDDDWAAILCVLNSDPEKVGLALNLCNAAGAKGKSVTLVLMQDAVYLGTKRFHEAAESKDGKEAAPADGKDAKWKVPEQLVLPKPFKSWKTLFAALIEKKGQVLCCTSCLKKRDISLQDDLLDCVTAIRGPDVVDITTNAGFTFQFT